MTRNYTVTQYNVHIPDSFEVSKHGFDAILDHLEMRYPDCEVWARKRWSLKAEWVTHSALYALGIARERTADVDLNAHLKWYASAAYWLIGAIVWPFIK